jgi:phenylacetate-coenzyme A ligase PaaK-like adenylate-forming protein
MQGGLVRCSETAAPLSICPDLYHLEVVDPNNGRRLSGGEPGMLAVTHLPGGPCCCALLVGDIVSAMPHLQALRKRVITTPRRIGNLIKCLGMLVNTEIIHGVLAAIEGVGEFQIVFMRGPKNGGMDHLVIRLERVAGAKNAMTSHDPTRRYRLLRPPEDRICLTRDLYDHECGVKLKRVVDLRPQVD